MSTLIRLLYAEDNPLDADLTRSHFSEHARDFDLEIVETGRMCLERLSETKHDLLLLDHRLPDMDGLDVLRSLIRTGVPIPVVFVTGWGDEDLVVKALRLGAVNYVPKHGNYLETLPDLLRRVFEEQRLRQSHGLFAHTSRRILYVEHFENDIDLTLRYFSEVVPQFEMEISRSCTDALSRLSRPPAYDAVLIDLRMPEQSGLDFVREAKGRHLSLPPFIMISCKGDESAAIASLKLGAADYVAKCEGYLDQLVYTIDRAIAHERLNHLNAQLQAQLAERERAQAERDKLEEQLRASQKMEAIGSLAGGIAHDFNNLLSVILSFTDLALERVTDDRLKEHLKEVRSAGELATTLTRQLLAFSRKQILQPVLLNLNETASGVEKMFRRILGENINYMRVLSPDLGMVRADPGQIEQVLLNLVINARDAMPSGGKLTIETSNVEIDEACAAHSVEVKPGPYVQLVVTDTGRGMDERTRKRVFEPFFTTKEKGKGTGLGLSTVYGIVKQSGGNIWVQSEPGQGAAFKICLPRELPSTTETDAQLPAVPRRSAGTETILVVEDEVALLRVARMSLEAAGYTVLTASDGQDALLICAQHAGDIHLLLTDVVMPRMSGRALAQTLSRTRPSLKVIYMSGYADDSVVRRCLLEPGARFLVKPFSMNDMTRKVRDVLDRGSTNVTE